MLGGRFIAISHLNFLSAWRVFFRKGVSQWYCHISAESTGCGMARKSQVEYPGAIYHLMNRGDRREPIFRDDEDRERFLATLGQGCFKTGWQVHAYCLMPNHFHLAVETPAANLVAGMKWFLGLYQSGCSL